MPRILYIIGNGFDLHHGLPSSYADFGSYLKKHHRRVAENLQTYCYVEDGTWGEFEKRLGWLEPDELIEDAAQYIEPAWSDHFDRSMNSYLIHIDATVESLTADLKQAFHAWLNSLEFSSGINPKAKCIYLQKNATFLNFNYTDTLRTLYGVSEDDIFHVHGKASDTVDSVILGHSWEAPVETDYSEHQEDEDFREAHGREGVIEYFSKSFKPTDRIIEHNQDFFHSLRDISEVFVFGHSLQNVDMPYFLEVRNVIKNASNVRWCISYYGEGELKKLRDQVSKIGLGSHQVSFIELSSLQIKPAYSFP